MAAQCLETRRRHDVRLDTFLRRTLSQEDFERVSTSEPCVIISPEEKRVHRHVILGHSRLYTTEFPPKNMRTVLKIEDLESISLLKDLPDFLSGEEQHNTVHIHLSYQRLVPAKEKNKFLSSLGNRKSPNLKRSSKVKNGEEYRPNSPSGTRKEADVGDEVVTQKKSPQMNPTSQPPIITLVPTGGGGNSAPQKSPRYSSRSKLEISHHVPNRNHLNSGDGEDEDDESPLTKSHPSHRSVLVSSPRARKRLEDLEKMQLKSASSMKSLVVPSSLLSTRGLSQEDRTLSQPELNEYSLGDSHGRRLKKYASRANSSETLSSSNGSIVGGGGGNLRSSRDFGSSHSLSKEPDEAYSPPGYCGREGASVDIYILNQVTDFYCRLKATWEDYKLNEVLHQPGLDSPGIPKVNSPKPYDQFWQQFCTLKEDFLSSRKLECLANLAQELSTACQKYFIIKKMFWEDSDLLDFCIDQLCFYLSGWNPRAGSLDDCIEYSIILMDLLYQMLKETHILPKRLVYFSRNGGHSLLSLVRAITHIFPPSLHIGQNQTREKVEKTCAVLYELFLVMDQGQWPSAKKTNISIFWLVESLLASRSKINLFFASLVDHASYILSRDLHLQEQVTLHQLSLVVHRFLNASSSVLRHFQKHFTEEFRYYISLGKAEAKLSMSHSKLNRDTIGILRGISSQVLGKGGGT